MSIKIEQIEELETMLQNKWIHLNYIRQIFNFYAFILCYTKPTPSNFNCGSWVPKFDNMKSFGVKNWNHIFKNEFGSWWRSMKLKSSIGIDCEKLQSSLFQLHDADLKIKLIFKC